MKPRAPRSQEAMVVLLGLTAGRRERRGIADYFASKGFDPLVPALPQWLGVQVCGHRLARYWAARVAAGNYRRVHVLVYISGGLIFRVAAARLDLRNVASIVFVRSPLQEQVSKRLFESWGPLGLLLLPRGKMLADLARADFGEPACPTSRLAQGLLVEMRPSRLALRLGVTASAVPAGQWETAAMLPAASDRRTLPISHDEAYSSDLLLSQVVHFARNGRFQSEDREAGANGAIST